MPPTISDPVTWQQAEILMQPAFIRLVDNIRKELEISSWKGNYQDVTVWNPDTTDEVKTLVTQLLKELESATPEQALKIRQNLAELPTPQPGYHLCLQRQGKEINIDMWELCYQICFLDYSSTKNSDVAIDNTLLDDTGDVDWHNLDEKTKGIVKQVFAELPD
ncbi:MAG: hypothetical protein QNJ49_17370 [Mastigocoleus sp. MO_167.B18]|uniref:hypothetical protein n=1 Tax=Mastigocoleus sp. MO_188.B34 TaxID=3036635 RepID=UPI00260EFB91|nr:hypothetical protein [Mastigocoleus sp. MO_188.B34]MDJ0693754.1 hypothetical protein [Mastigocoleus sp. MO_188.B34]MDJ0775169.1 hypothetical protein [Mastigocoleus sp. MO_167.B18]